MESVEIVSITHTFGGPRYIDISRSISAQEHASLAQRTFQFQARCHIDDDLHTLRMDRTCRFRVHVVICRAHLDPIQRPAVYHCLGKLEGHNSKGVGNTVMNVPGHGQ